MSVIFLAELVMDPLLLSRLQFALTTAFHYLFPPMTIGLGLLLVVMEGAYLRTGRKLYEEMTRFWIRVFALIFSVGVATGIVLEFEFGTNWASYSRFVGDVFGSALAAEGIFAFFLESGFLAILVFGWQRVGPRMHFFSTVMVALGSIFSAVWIIVANSWQQTPAGYHLVERGGVVRAEITDFWALVFNPSTLERLSHVLGGALLAGAFLVASVAAYYLLRKRHRDFAERSLKIALVAALIGAFAQIITGHASAVGVAEHQPAKLAAFEGHYPERAPADLYLMGWVDEENEQVRLGLKLPGMLSWLVHLDASRPLPGLRSYAPADRPPVNAVFQSYHAMVAAGMAMLLLAVLGVFFWWRGTLFDKSWLLKLLVPAVLLPHLGNELGWFSAEVGRQPWLVYGKLRTAEGLSRAVSGGQVLFSLILFTLLYALLGLLFLFILNHKIQHGPGEDEDAERASA